MTELKTLKGLEWKTYHSCTCGGYEEGCLSCFDEDLKKEAIKWVKRIDNDLKPYESTQGTLQKNKDVDFVVGNIATREWIKNFFNITEDDLK